MSDLNSTDSSRNTLTTSMMVRPRSKSPRKHFSMIHRAVCTSRAASTYISPIHHRCIKQHNLNGTHIIEQQNSGRGIHSTSESETRLSEGTLGKIINKTYTGRTFWPPLRDRKIRETHAKTVMDVIQTTLTSSLSRPLLFDLRLQTARDPAQDSIARSLLEWSICGYNAQSCRRPPFLYRSSSTGELKIMLFYAVKQFGMLIPRSNHEILPELSHFAPMIPEQRKLSRHPEEDWRKNRNLSVYNVIHLNNHASKQMSGRSGKFVYYLIEPSA